MKANVFPHARPFAYAGGKRPKQWLYPDFNPTIDPKLVARAYAYWVRKDKPPVYPGFLEEVLQADQTVEAHLFWFEDVINYIRDNEI